MAVYGHPRANYRYWVTIALLLGYCCAAEAVEFAGGAGTMEDPYRIATARQLLDMGSDPALLDKSFILVDDIDMEDHYGPTGHLRYPVIAPEDGPAFEGWLDGQGHTIRHLRIRPRYGDGIGLIGRVGMTGLDTASLKDDQTLREAGWDLAATWLLCEGDYPRLWWEGVECP